MPTIRANALSSTILQIGGVLTVTGAGKGLVSRHAHPNGSGPDFPPVPFDAATLTFGPFDTVAVFGFSCERGPMIYATTTPIPTVVNKFAPRFTRTIKTTEVTSVIVPAGSVLNLTGGGIGALFLAGEGERIAKTLDGTNVTIDAVNYQRVYRVVCTLGSISIETAWFTGAINTPTPGTGTPTPSPSPTPTPTPGTGVPAIIDDLVFEGDSWVRSDYVGYYAGAFKTARASTLNITGLAVGGQGLNDLVRREGEVIAAKPDLLHSGIGRNDNATSFPYATAQDFLTTYFAHLQRLKDALPNLLITVETLCARQVANETANNTFYNNRRGEINAALRAAVGKGLINDIVDFAASPEIGTDAVMMPQPVSDYTISVDGLHLWDMSSTGRNGHNVAYEIFTTTIDRVIRQRDSKLAITQTSTRGSKPFGWQIENTAGIPFGDYWRVQRATGATEAQALANLNAETLNGQAIQQITPADLIDGDVTFPDLGVTPSGWVALRLCYGRDDGGTGYVWYPWSNVVTDNVA